MLHPYIKLNNCAGFLVREVVFPTHAHNHVCQYQTGLQVEKQHNDNHAQGHVFVGVPHFPLLDIQDICCCSQRSGDVLWFADHE